MYHMIYKFTNKVVEPFVEGDHDLPVPRIVNPSDPYKCKAIRINGLAMEKPMFWCRPRRYFIEKQYSDPESRTATDTDSDSDSEPGVVNGFFCAGSLNDKSRVYVFRPLSTNDQEVKPVAELNNYRPEKSS